MELEGACLAQIQEENSTEAYVPNQAFVLHSWDCSLNNEYQILLTCTGWRLEGSLTPLRRQSD